MQEEDLSALPREEVESRASGLRDEMRPLEQRLAELRARRDLLLTELRRRDRLDQRQARAAVRESARQGAMPTVEDLVAGKSAGAFEEYVYNLGTGGEVRLGFPGARSQTLTFTNGARAAQARDFADAARLFEAGWELGSPGRPGIRVHLAGSRQERLVDASQVFARPAATAEDS